MVKQTCTLYSNYIHDLYMASFWYVFFFKLLKLLDVSFLYCFTLKLLLLLFENRNRRRKTNLNQNINIEMADPKFFYGTYQVLD